MAAENSTGDIYPSWDDRINRYRELMSNPFLSPHYNPGQAPYIGDPLPGQAPYIGDQMDEYEWQKLPKRILPQPFIPYPSTFPTQVSSGTTLNPDTFVTIEIDTLKKRTAELELKVMQLITILDYITGVESGKKAVPEKAEA